MLLRQMCEKRKLRQRHGGSDWGRPQRSRNMDFRRGGARDGDPPESRSKSHFATHSANELRKASAATANNSLKE